MDAGFNAVPMPMDFDGDLDLLISESASYTESGIFYFENISGNVPLALFRTRTKVSFERRRLGVDWARFQVSAVQGRIHVLTPDRVREKLLVYKDIPEKVFWDENEVMLPEEGYDYLFASPGVSEFVQRADHRNPSFSFPKTPDSNSDFIDEIICW